MRYPPICEQYNEKTDLRSIFCSNRGEPGDIRRSWNNQKFAGNSSDNEATAGTPFDALVETTLVDRNSRCLHPPLPY
ncbi:hypothetical protein [Methanosphaerula subterraneus]|uniref:hypothetical protein n=1 Tax=Methanosphaerula subterraneus TaxID=3350244 RepID=UPI003F8551D2